MTEPEAQRESRQDRPLLINTDRHPGGVRPSPNRLTATHGLRGVLSGVFQPRGTRDPLPLRTASGRLIRWWRLAVGLGLLCTLIFAVGPRELLLTFRGLRPGWAVAMAGVLVAWLSLGMMNVWLLLRCLSPVPLGVFSNAYATSWATALILPGQLGDATQMLFLRARGVAAEKSGAAYVVDKAVSLAWLLSVAAYGVGVYAPSLLSLWWLPPTILLLAGVGITALCLIPSGLEGRTPRLKSVVTGLVAQLRSLRRYPGAVGLNVVLTMVKWVLMAFSYKTAFRAFGVTISTQAAATIPVMSSLVGYVPVTVGGAGTVEWTAVFLFALEGVAQGAVLGVYLLMRTTLVLIAGLSLLATRSVAT